MSTKIRLARGGSKKRPYYRVVVADSRSPRDGKFIEKVGTYNPMLVKGDEGRVNLVQDRIEYWLSKGAVPSDKVVLFLNDAKIGQDNSNVKLANKKRDNVIEIKKVEIAAKKKKEAEEKAAAEAAKKAEEEAAAKEAEEAAKAEAEAKAAEEAAAAAEAAPAEEEKPAE